MSAVQHAHVAVGAGKSRSPTATNSFQALMWRWGGERLVWALLAIAVFVIAIVPLIYTVNAAFYGETRTGLSNERDLTAILNVYFGAEYLGYLANALVLAVVVTALSLFVGVGMAILMARTDLPFKNTLDLLIIMPLFLSPFTGLIAWITLGSQKTGFVNVAYKTLFNTLGIDVSPLINIWSYGGVAWVMFLFFCPFAYLFTVGNLRAMDSSLEEAARMSGATPFQALTRITLPMALPAILASGLLIFILAAEMYTIPGIIGGTAGFTTLPWKIFQDSTVFPVHRAHAAAAGTMLLWITILGVWLQRRITRRSERFVTVSGKGFRGRPLSLGRKRWLALAAIGVYVLSADILPFGALILSSFMKYSAPTLTSDVFTLTHYQQIFTLQDMRAALWNTTWLAVLCGTICVLVGLLISFMEVRRPSHATRVVAFMGVLPVAVPGLVYGIGLLWAYIQTPIYGTPWILLLAFVAKFLPYGIVVSRSAVIQLHPELEQSARMSGATGLVALRKITMPLLKPTLIAILFFVMLMSIKELSASVLLYSQKSQVLSVLTWHYMDAGNYQFAAAIGVLQTVMMIGLVIFTRAIFRVQMEKALSK
ncbi:ABC transporter permease [Mesorhizobium sp. 1B3]|uniref:ABC transporter permease n=1 Tax=Mesorhizobium sp. 1B3 TaxID=3243599 RepID=UPI003D95164D